MTRYTAAVNNTLSYEQKHKIYNEYWLKLSTQINIGS